MNKQLTVMFVLSIAIIALLTLPALDREKVMEQASDSMMDTRHAYDAATEARQTSNPDADGESQEPAEAQAFPALTASAAPDLNGFRLTFEDGRNEYIRSLEEDAFDDFAVHLVERDDSSSDSEEDGRHHYDLVVVRPERMEVKTYPLYSATSGGRSHDHHLKMVDERHVMFVQRSENGNDGSLVYELAILDLENGHIRTLPAFWTVAKGSEEYEEDFLLSAQFAHDENGVATRALLSSFLGKMWLFDLQSGEWFSHGGQTYPAIGDPGSSPPRSLLYPTPDLERFIYRFPWSNHFMLADTKSGDVNNVFSVEDGMTLSDPGPVWNREGSRFFLEYAAEGNEQGEYFDTGHAVSAEAIGFYDRDGKRMKVLKAGSGERMSVYNWLDEHRVLIETYKTISQSDSVWAKGEIAYKEYDVLTGKLNSYRHEGEAAKLADPKIVPLRREGATFDSKAAVILDEKNKRIWEPNVYGWTYPSTNGELYLDSWSGEFYTIYRWSKERLQLDTVAIGSDLRVIAGNWLILREQEGDGFVYRNANAEIPRNE